MRSINESGSESIAYEGKTPPKIKGLFFSKKEIEVARSLKGGETGCLLNASIEIPGNCNLRCPYCFTFAAKRQKDELTEEAIVGIIGQIKDIGAKSVVINGCGEPFMNPALIMEILSSIRKEGLQPLVFTNGTFIDEAMAKWLYNKKISVIAKLNSFKPEIQDFLAGVNGASSKMKQGLDNLIKVGLNKKNLLACQSIISKPNYAEMPLLWTWLRKNRIIPFIETFSNVGLAADNVDALFVPPSDLKALMERILAIDQKEFGYSWIPSPPYIGSNCNRCYYTCHITSIGTVKPCPLLPVEAGNVKEQPLRAILKQDIFEFTRNIEKHIKKSGTGACSKCSLLGKCYGCRSRAFIASKATTIEEKLVHDDTQCWRTKSN